MKPTRVIAPSLLLLVVLLGQVVLADTSAQRPRAPVTTADLFANMLPVLGVASDPDGKSPIKADVTVWDGNREKLVNTGIKNFQGSMTALRAAVSYAFLRAGGLELKPPVAAPWAIENAFAFPQGSTRGDLEKAFKEVTGKNLVKKKIGAGDKALLQYDSAALQSAFDKFYVPPTANLGGVKARIVYNTLFKDYVAKKALVIAGILANPERVVSASASYARAAADPAFEGPEFQYKVASEDFKNVFAGDERLIGTILRRQADGSLPALLKMLRTVLRDYDPDTSKALDSRLKAP